MATRGYRMAPSATVDITILSIITSPIQTAQKIVKKILVLLAERYMKRLFIRLSLVSLQPFLL